MACDCRASPLSTPVASFGPEIASRGTQAVLGAVAAERCTHGLVPWTQMAYSEIRVIRTFFKELLGLGLGEFQAIYSKKCHFTVKNLRTFLGLGWPKKVLITRISL